jgi:hypothetical protein
MRIICLANSFKEGGRCLAGIEINADNTPVIVNNRPKWIRPVCATEHEEVPTHLVSHMNLLDIVEFEQTENVGQGHQMENVRFRESSLQVVGSLTAQSLANMTDNERLVRIFGNRGKAVSEEAIENLNHSLMLLSTDDFEVNEKVYVDNPDRPQIRLAFRYRGNLYDLPVTDPVFLHRLKGNTNLLEDIEQIYLVLSLGGVHNDWYYKLIAGIIY